MLVRLSQGLLELLEFCPRKFQYHYLEQLGSTALLELQERLTWGSRFHQLMQQQELGLPLSLANHLPAEEVEGLQRCVEALRQHAPNLFLPLHSQAAGDRLPHRYSEHSRSLWVDGVLLTVVYDLLILGDRQATIIDWKTYPRPRQPQFLLHHWQTRLYPFVLAETTPYSPDQITMAYWFVQTQEPNGTITPQHLTIPYNHHDHEHTRQDLERWVRSLTAWMQAYEQGIPFPQVEEATGRCSTCPFQIRCQRGEFAQGAGFDHLVSLSDIEEIVP